MKPSTSYPPCFPKPPRQSTTLPGASQANSGCGLEDQKGAKHDTMFSSLRAVFLAMRVSVSYMQCSFFLKASHSHVFGGLRAQAREDASKPTQNSIGESFRFRAHSTANQCIWNVAPLPALRPHEQGTPKHNSQEFIVIRHAVYNLHCTRNCRRSCANPTAVSLLSIPTSSLQHAG